MPTSFKTGGRTPAGCAEARKLKANGDRNNTIANARSMIRLPSFDLCNLGTNISLFFSFSWERRHPCLLRSREPRRQGCLRSQVDSPAPLTRPTPLNVVGVEPAAAWPTAVAPIAEPVAGTASEH